MELETRLHASDFVDAVSDAFFHTAYGEPNTPLRTLRNIKMFLYREPELWKPHAEGTLLDSTYCLTFSVIAHLLASRAGVETTVVRPVNFFHSFHAMLTYLDGEKQVEFQVLGVNRQYGSVPLSDTQIETRLRFLNPLMDIVNSVRFKEGHPLYAIQRWNPEAPQLKSV